MRISSIFVLASRLKEDTEESKRHRISKKADSDEGFEIILFGRRLRDGVKNLVLCLQKFSRDLIRIDITICKPLKFVFSGINIYGYIFAGSITCNDLFHRYYDL